MSLSPSLPPSLFSIPICFSVKLVFLFVCVCLSKFLCACLSPFLCVWCLCFFVFVSLFFFVPVCLLFFVSVCLCFFVFVSLFFFVSLYLCLSLSVLLLFLLFRCKKNYVFVKKHEKHKKHPILYSTLERLIVPFPWYLYHIVIQYTMRTAIGRKFFKKKKQMCDCSWFKQMP